MYGVHINKDALKYVNSLTEKSERLIKRKLEILKEDPHPGRDDKKKLQLPDYDLFRMHVGRSFTIFYRIYEAEKVVKVLDIMTIEKAHKRYGRL
ncbi:MAG: type II toxin-antitoxin system RelE/ParE family toxin [Methanosarcinales archaeon]|nr:type II toxin-antitoxin system RelE/ParE family toxin [Methanosarcinales archaeon]